MHLIQCVNDGCWCCGHTGQSIKVTTLKPFAHPLAYPLQSMTTNNGCDYYLYLKTSSSQAFNAGDFKGDMAIELDPNYAAAYISQSLQPTPQHFVTYRLYLEFHSQYNF